MPRGHVVVELFKVLFRLYNHDGKNTQNRTLRLPKQHYPQTRPRPPSLLQSRGEKTCGNPDEHAGVKLPEHWEPDVQRQLVLEDLLNKAIDPGSFQRLRPDYHGFSQRPLSIYGSHRKSDS